MQQALDIDVEKDRIDAFTKEDYMECRVCEYLMEFSDSLERQKREFQVFERARTLKIAKDFNALYKAYKQKIALDKSNRNGYRTKFIDQPIELNCGDWECSTMVRKLVGESMKIASPIPLLVTKILKNVEDEIEKIELSFYKNGYWQSVICKRSVAGNASKIIELADCGIEVNSDNAKTLVQYIADLVRFNFDVIPAHQAIGRLGWYEDDFIPYNHDIKFDGEKEFRTLYDAVGVHGDFDKWVKFTGKLRENILLRLQMATSFASPLIEKVNALPFILHFWGGTGNGKTVGMMVASSIWGNPQRGKMWRTLNNTINFVMQMSNFFHNLPVCMDELQTIKQFNNTYDKLIMCITEGIDRVDTGNKEKEERGKCSQD